MKDKELYPFTSLVNLFLLGKAAASTWNYFFSPPIVAQIEDVNDSDRLIPMRVEGRGARQLPDFSDYESSRQDAKEDLEFGIHFAGIVPAELYVPSTFHHHIVSVSPNITYGESIEDMTVRYTITATDDRGNEAEVEYDIVTEIVRGDERQVILVRPFNPIYRALDHEIRINTADIFNSATMEFHEIAYEFHIEQADEASLPHLVRNLISSRLIHFDDANEEESDYLSNNNPFALLDDDDDDDDDDESSDDEQDSNNQLHQEHVITKVLTSGNLASLDIPPE